MTTLTTRFVLNREYNPLEQVTSNLNLGDEESPPIRLPTLMNVIPKSKGFEDDREGRYGFKLVISDAQGRLNLPLFSQDRGSLLPR